MKNTGIFNFAKEAKNLAKELIQFCGFIVCIGRPGIIGLFRVRGSQGMFSIPLSGNPVVVSFVFSV